MPSIEAVIKEILSLGVTEDALASAVLFTVVVLSLKVVEEVLGLEILSQR